MPTIHSKELNKTQFIVQKSTKLATQKQKQNKKEKKKRRRKSKLDLHTNYLSKRDMLELNGQKKKKEKVSQ